jgi:hypothetical protein
MNRLKSIFQSFLFFFSSYKETQEKATPNCFLTSKSIHFCCFYALLCPIRFIFPVSLGKGEVLRYSELKKRECLLIKFANSFSPP